MERFLVGYDGSTAAREALRTAAHLARQSNGHVAVVVATTPAGAAPGLLARIGASALDSDAAVDCARDATQILGAVRVPSSVQIVDGIPARALADAAADRNSDLILIGHHGRGALAELVLGSTAKAVVADARCPVLVVGESTPPALDRILVALDGSEESRNACDAAIELARVSKGRLFLLHVINTSSLERPHRGQVMARLQVAGEREGVRLLAEGARRCAAAGVPADIRQVRGPAAAEIVRAAAQRGAGLIAIGRSARSRVERLTFGSVGDAILRTARHAVLVASTNAPAPAPPAPRLPAAVATP